MKRKGEEVDGWIGFLMNSFILFVMGWSRLKGFIMFGFFWVCM